MGKKMKQKINLINDDCMNIMPDYTDDYFDLAIVDPPYGIKEDGKSNHSRGLLAETTNRREDELFRFI